MAKSKITEAARAFIGAPPVDAMRPQVVPSAKAVGAEARALGAATRRAVSPANQFVLGPALDSPRPTPRVPNKQELILDGKRTAERYVNARTAEPLDLDYRTGDKRTPFRQTPTPTNPSYRPAPAPAAGASGPRLKPGAGPARTSTLGRVANNVKLAAGAVKNSVAAGPGAVNTGNGVLGFLDSGSSTSRAKIDKMGKARQILNGVYRAPESGPGVVRRTVEAVTNGAGRVTSGVKAAAAAQGTSGLGVADRMRAGLNAATAARPAAPAASAAQAGLVRRGLGWGATAAGRVAGVAGRVATPVLATMGAYKSGTMSGEDRQRFNDTLGVSDSKSVAGDLANNTANVAFNVGNSLTGGFAEKLGNGLGSWAAGDSFKDGWNDKTLDERGGPKPADGRAPGGGAWTPSVAPAGWGDQAKKDVAQQSSDTTAITNANALADQMQRRSAAGGLMVAPNNRYDPDAAVYASGAVKDGGMYDKASPGTVIGQFNGRDITKAESEVRGGSLVTSSGPVAMGGGGFAASTGRSMAQQAAEGGGQPTGTAMVTGGRGESSGQQNMQRRGAGQVGDAVGGYAGFRGGDASGDPQARNIRGDLYGSDSERKSAIENIDAAIKSLTTENGGLNMRSKRELLGRYVEQRNEIATMPYDVQNRRDVEGARLDAEMSTRNADRGLERDKFGWDVEKFGIDRQDKIDAAEAARNAPPTAKELREADAYNLDRRNKRDNDDEKQAADLAGQYLKSGVVTDPTEALTMANQALANLAMDTGQKFDTQSRTAGGVANIDQFNDEMSQNSDGMWSRAMAGRNPFANNPTLNRNYDAANLEVQDYSWYNPRNLADAFVLGNQFDDSYVEGPRDANGLSTFRGLRGELEKSEFEKKRDRAAASRRSMPEY